MEITRKNIGWYVFFVIFLVIVLGRFPDEINLIFVKWDLNGVTTTTTTTTMETTTTRILTVSIEELKSEQQIYSVGDLAYAHFTIENSLMVPYNITVDWIYNNTRYHGWNTTNTEFYNTTEVKNNWRSWYTVKYKGKWLIHLQVKYKLGNKTYSSDETTEFDVI